MFDEAAINRQATVSNFTAIGSNDFGFMRRQEAASQKAGSMKFLSGETNISSV